MQIKCYVDTWLMWMKLTEFMLLSCWSYLGKTAIPPITILTKMHSLVLTFFIRSLHGRITLC